MKADKASQNQRVFEYMQKHPSINYKIAIHKLGVTRLASRISDLKRMGKVIQKEMVADYDEDGSFICNHAEYSLMEE